MIKKIRSKIYNLLRWSEKFFKTDMVYLAKGGSWLTLGQGVASISALLLSVAFANLIPKEVYGEYKYILSLAGIIGAFSLTGMGTAMIQAVARGFNGTLRQGFITSLKWSIGVIVISFTSSLYYFLNDNSTLAISLFIVGTFTPLLNSFGLYGAFLIGKKDFKAPAIYASIENISSAMILVATMIFTHNPIIFVFTYFTAHTFFSILFYSITIKKYPQNASTKKQTISYGKHLSIINIFGILAIHLDKILIFHYLGAVQLAIYAFAVAIPEQIKGVIKGIGALALPKFSQTTLNEIKKTIQQKILKMSIVILAITILYILTAPFIFKILFPQYLESIFYSQLFALSLPAGAAVISISALQAIAKSKVLYQINISTSILQTILMFFFVYYYGLIGAIIARIITRYIGLYLSLYLLRK